MEIRFPLRGRAVVLVWFSLLGAGLVLLACWQGGGQIGFLAGLGWAAAGSFLWRRMSGVRLRCHTSGRLVIHSGRLLALETTLASGAVLRTAVLSTPLLRAAGCRVLTLFTLHGQIVLPGLSARDAAALCAAVCPEPP